MRNDNAVKYFHEIKHLIQEYIAGSYLDDARNIVHIREVDLNKMKLTMELYHMNLRHWMEENHLHKLYDKRMAILHEILVGLVEIHDRGLIHADIKPGNILLSEHPLRVAIGDLGFVSLQKYAKARYTAAVYRDKTIRQNYTHDMFSLGVLMLELFGRIRVRKPCSSRELASIARRTLTKKDIRGMVLRLTHVNPYKRPTARQVLQTLYEEDLEVEHKWIPAVKDITKCHQAISLIRDLGQKYNLAMIERCIEALKYYLQTHEVQDGNCDGYAVAMLLISASLYRLSKFNFKRALHYSQCQRERFLIYLRDLLANNDVITILLKSSP
jgi:serine/threonine protein kinase